MGKISTFMILAIGMMSLLWITGFISSGMTPALFNMLIGIGSTGWKDLVGNMFNSTYAIISLSVIVSAAVTALSGRVDLSIFLFPAGFMLDLIWGAVDIGTKLAEFGNIGYIIGVLVIAPLAILFVVGMLEWWRGIST